MATLLRVDASARGDRSLSRHMTRTFEEAWRKHRPHDRVIARDVGAEPPPFITEAWVASAFTPAMERTPEQRHLLELSDTLIDELVRADLIVMGAPMYNYGMPATLKAWFDQVIRIGKTFSFDLGRGDWPLEPILSGKTLVVLTSHGEFGFEAGQARAHMDHLGPHIATLARYLGVAERHTISIEYQEFRDERHERSVAKATVDIIELAGRLACSYRGC